MADTLAPANLFRRLTFILIAVVGLIVLIVGGWLLASQGWEKAGGTVGQCQTRIAGLGILLLVVSFVMMRRERKAV